MKVVIVSPKFSFAVDRRRILKREFIRQENEASHPRSLRGQAVAWLDLAAKIRKYSASLRDHNVRMCVKYAHECYVYSRKLP